MKFLVILMILVSCGRKVPVNGKDGINGSAGVQGFSTIIEQLSVDQSACLNGGTAFKLALDVNRNNLIDDSDENVRLSIICNGINGIDGIDGSDGVNGVDGEDGTDGQDGADGQQGEKGDNGVDGVNLAQVTLLNPCGDAPGLVDEIIIRLPNGTLLATFTDSSNGKDLRLAVISEGDFETRDGDNCSYSIDSNNNIVNESHIHWSCCWVELLYIKKEFIWIN